jgi:hypothetical protein
MEKAEDVPMLGDQQNHDPPSPDIAAAGDAAEEPPLPTTREVRLSFHERISKKDCILILVSVAFLVLAVLAINDTSFAVSLGFKNQLVIVGVSLNLISFCLGQIVGATLLEWRSNPLGIGDYNLVVGNDFLARGLRKEWWRLVPFFLSAMPIAFGAGYKQAIGGQVTGVKHLDDAWEKVRSYGLAPPTGTEESFQSLGHTPGILMNITAHFLQTSSTDEMFKVVGASLDKGPVPYGYNLLLLGNNSAAALDLPRASYLRAIKDQLEDGESWIVTAEVDGYVTHLNETIDALRDDDSFWVSAIDEAAGPFKGISSFSFFDNDPKNRSSLGLLPFISNPGPYASACLFGTYRPSRTFWADSYSSSNDSEVSAFRNSASLFTTHRAKCSGTWTITRDSFRLTDGNCDTSAAGRVESAVFAPEHAGLYAIYPLDVLPILVHSLYDFAHTRVDSPWKLPSYTVAVVASYWSRGAFMGELDKQMNVSDIIASTAYQPRSESVLTRRSALSKPWWLYMIICSQTVLTVFAWLGRPSVFRRLWRMVTVALEFLGGVARTLWDTLGSLFNKLSSLFEAKE